MSRNEDILQSIINGESLENFRPQSRMEALLKQLGGASGGGIIDVEELPSKWKGTPVPNTGYVENVYLNTNLSINEVNKIIKSITNGRYVALSDAEHTQAIGFIGISEDGIDAAMIMDAITNTVYFASTEELGLDFVGWNPDVTFPIAINSTVVSNVEIDVLYEVGMQNDKLSSLFSTTPFELEKVNVDEQVLYRVYSKEAIPETGTVKLSNLKMNFSLSVEETVAILKQLTYQIDGAQGYYDILILDIYGDGHPATYIWVRYDSEADLYLIEADEGAIIFASKTNEDYGVIEGWHEDIYNDLLQSLIAEGSTEVPTVSQTTLGEVYQNDKLIDIICVDSGYKLYHCKEGFFYEIGGATSTVTVPPVTVPSVTEKTITIVKTMAEVEKESTIKFMYEEIQQLTTKEDVIVRVLIGESTELPLISGSYIDYKKFTTAVIEGARIVQLFGIYPEKAAIRFLTITVYTNGNIVVAGETFDPEQLKSMYSVSVDYEGLLTRPYPIPSYFENLYSDCRYELNLVVEVNSREYAIKARKILNNNYRAPTITLQFEAYAEIPNGDGSVTIIDKILTVNNKDYMLTMTDRASSSGSGSGSSGSEVVELLLSFQDNTITTPVLTDESNISFINLLEKIKAKQPNSITLSPIIFSMEGASQGLYGSTISATISEVEGLLIGSIGVVNNASIFFGIMRTSDANAVTFIGDDFDASFVQMLDGQTLKFCLN